MPSDVADNSAASLTLDYAFDDWAVGVFSPCMNGRHVVTLVTGTLAQGLGKSASEVEMFLNRSQNYRNIWDPKSQYFCARKTTGVRGCSVSDV